MKPKILKILLITKDTNIVRKVNAMLQDEVQVTHFEEFNEAIFSEINDYNLSIITMANQQMMDKLPTIFLTKMDTKCNDSAAVYLNIDLFFAENFNGLMLKFAIQEAISKYELAEKFKKQHLSAQKQAVFIQQLIAAFSDNLQEPLNSTSRFLQLLRQRYEFSLDKIGHQFLDYILRETNLQHEQLERLLEYLQIGTEDVFLDNVEVNAVMKDAINALEHSEEVDNQVFHVRYKALPNIHYNRYHLMIIFSELLSNAIKFRKLNHFVQIEVNVQEIPEFWIFEIKDNGEGFEMENAAIVFHIFKKLHNRLLYKGVGVGLSIVKKIVEFYNGEISIESEINKGTVVQFTIPKQM